MAEAIALIDYGAGNLQSVHNALRAAGAERVAVTADPKLVRGARRIVLPGVGSFKACMEGLAAIPGMIGALEKRVLADGVPFLGVCVGMQLMAERGLEHGETPGLGWIEGQVSLSSAPIARSRSRTWGGTTCRRHRTTMGHSWSSPAKPIFCTRTTSCPTMAAISPR